MQIFRFEVCRGAILVQKSEYQGPLTAQRALECLKTENPRWVGKLTAKESETGLWGSSELDAEKTYVLRLPDLAGRTLFMLHVLCVFLY